MAAAGGRGDEFEDLVAGVLAAGSQAVWILEAAEVAAHWNQPSALPQMTVGALAAHLALMIEAGVTWLDTDPAEHAHLTPTPVGRLFGLARVDPDEGLAGRIPRFVQTSSADAAERGPAETRARATSA